MGVRRIVLALVILTLLALALDAAIAGDADPPSVCVSAVGPVDADGRGNPTAVETGDCPAQIP